MYKYTSEDLSYIDLEITLNFLRQQQKNYVLEQENFMILLNFHELAGGGGQKRILENFNKHVLMH